ncbi:hypothetical protein RhiirA5_428964 [Rhizophagus irregularis]|uniref:Uncharacterized protein n=1 Tax=Rhizophagus irregularis TaxID=588596 RepID=A0A2N0NZB3_9GLOM|nr:hypothetical protein RhiirA5_428964 [Rhizophagus irregularis]
MLKKNDKEIFEGNVQLIPKFISNVIRSISIGAVSVAVVVAFVTKLIITGQNSSVTIVGLICSVIGLFISGKSFIKKSRTRIDVPNSCIILILKKKQRLRN